MATFMHLSKVFLGFGILALSGCSFASSSSSTSQSSVQSLASSSSEASSSSTSTAAVNPFERVENASSLRALGDSQGMHYLRSTGDQKILVIPIHINESSSKQSATLQNSIQKAFFGESSDTGWESLASYYEQSSYGQLHLSGAVSDFYDSGYSISDLSGTDTVANSNFYKMINGAVSWYKTTTKTDGTEFDIDGDGFLDAVWFVYDIMDYSNYYYRYGTNIGSTFWAFTSWMNNQADVASPVINSFSWASYDFLFEGYGSALDAHTLIHETGHLLGLEDYYDYDQKASPMGLIDMMDNNIIDHNAFSKFALGWVKPYLIDQLGSFVLKPSSSSGECLLVPDDGSWNGTAFDEYLMLEYYTPDGLNSRDSARAYGGNGLQGFTQKGVRIYHVDARLAEGLTDSSTSYCDTISTKKNYSTYLAHSNTASQNCLNQNYRLVQEMDCTSKRNFAADNFAANNSSLFQKGDYFDLDSYKGSFPNGAAFNNGGSLEYQISFETMTSEGIEVVIG